MPLRSLTLFGGVLGVALMVPASSFAQCQKGGGQPGGGGQTGQGMAQGGGMGRGQGMAKGQGGGMGQGMGMGQAMGGGQGFGRGMGQGGQMMMGRGMGGQGFGRQRGMQGSFGMGQQGAQQLQQVLLMQQRNQALRNAAVYAQAAQAQQLRNATRANTPSGIAQIPQYGMSPQ